MITCLFVVSGLFRFNFAFILNLAISIIVKQHYGALDSQTEQMLSTRVTAALTSCSLGVEQWECVVVVHLVLGDVV